MKVNHDFHIHTNLSLCAPDATGTVENYIESAKKHGLVKLGFANHFWGSEPGNREYFKNTKMADDRLNPIYFYDVQNFEHVMQLLPELKAVDEDNIKVYFGAECEYDPFKKSIAVTWEQVEAFDFIIVPNSHTHVTMPQSFYEPYEKHIEFMFDAFYDIVNCEFSKYITAIAHPFCAVACPYDRNILNRMISDDDYKRAFDAAANKDIAFEINVWQVSAENLQSLDILAEDIRMAKLAKECGCKLIFGSDAHIISEHQYYNNADKIAEVLGLTQDDIAEIAR